MDDVQIICRERLGDLVALEETLSRLAQINPRYASVVDLRIFCGFGNEEIAKALKISTNTVMRDWNFASRWLQREMKRGRKGRESA